MQWLDAVPAMLAAMTVVIGPGLLLGWSMRVKGFALIAFSPLLSVSLVAVAAVVSATIGLSWSAWPVAALTLLASAVAFGVVRRSTATWVPRRGPDSRFVFAIAGTLIAAVISGFRLTYVFGSPDSISQTYDNIFHLNAVQYILETHQASSFTVGGMTGIPFYPAGWHAVVALTVQLSGASIPIGVNAANLIIGAVVWPLSCILLCQQVVGQSRLAALLAGVLSTAFGAFPLMMLDFGVLYPNLLSISVLPALLALGTQLLRLTVVQDLPPLGRGLAMLIAVPGVALSHPSTLMAFLAFLTPATLLVSVTSWRRWLRCWPESRGTAIRWTAALGVGIIATVLLWRAVRPVAEAAFWPPIQSPVSALAELALNAEMNRPPALLASVLVVIGVVAMLRRRYLWWVVGMFGVACLLFIVVSSFRPGRLRDFVTAIWYNDSYRLAALVPVAGVVVATYGAFILIRMGWKYLARKSKRSISAPTGRMRRISTAGAPLMAGVTIAAVAFLSQLGGLQFTTEKARAGYELRPDSPLITSDEMAVLRDMKGLVPAGSVVAVNAWNGSALVYALANRTPTEFHVLSDSLSRNDRILLDNLRDADTDPKVCPAVLALNVTYVLDFGQQEINDGSHPAPGVQKLEESGTVIKLAQHGDAKLFKLKACH